MSEMVAGDDGAQTTHIYRQWRAMWGQLPDEALTLTAEGFLARASAIAEDVPLLDQVTVDKLDQMLRRIPDNTGLGSDCVEPGAIKHAPVGAIHELCHVLDCIIRNEVLPWGLLYLVIALLPKDGAAFWLLPIFVRILNRLFYDQLSAWW